MASSAPQPALLLRSPLVVSVVATFLGARDTLDVARTCHALRAGAACEQRIGLRLCHRAMDTAEVLGKIGAPPFVDRFAAASLHLLHFDAAQHAALLAALGGGTLCSLELRRCVPRALVSIAPLLCLRSLVRLSMFSCRDMVSLDGIAAALAALRHLSMRNCTSISDLAPLAALSHLSHLDVSGCTSVSCLEPVAKCAALRVLVAERAGIRRLPDLRAFRGGLQALNMAWCSLADESALIASPDLVSLELQFAGSASGGGPVEAPGFLPFLGECPALTSLDLSGCKAQGGDEVLAPLPLVCPSLRQLRLRLLGGLRSARGLGGCVALQSLALDEAGIASLDGLGSCVSLRTLNLSGCAALACVQGLRGCTALETLELWGCKSLSSLRGVEGCPALCTLRCWGCRALADVFALSSCGGMPHLQHLELGQCERVRSIDALAACTQLRTVGLIECTGLRSVNALASNSEHLTTLNMSSCTGVADVSCLAECTALRVLNVEGMQPSGIRQVVAGCKDLHSLIRVAAGEDLFRDESSGGSDDGGYNAQQGLN